MTFRRLTILIVLILASFWPGAAPAQRMGDAEWQRRVNEQREQQQRDFQDFQDRAQRERQLQEERRFHDELLNQQRMNGVLDYIMREKELRQRERERPCQPGAMACP